MKVFQIFINQDPHQAFKTFVWRMEDDYLMRLGGVQMKVNQEGGLALNPVYYPLFSWKSAWGIHELTIYLDEVSYIFFQSGWSLTILRSTGRDIEERD